MATDTKKSHTEDFLHIFHKLVCTAPSNEKCARIVKLLEPNHAWICVNNEELSAMVCSRNMPPDISSFLKRLRENTQLNKQQGVMKLHLYWALHDLLSFSEILATEFTMVQIPTIVSQDLANMQADYTANKEIKDIVDHGFSVIFNCCRYPSLHHSLRMQIQRPILAFLDPAVNDIDRVLDAVVIIELVNPGNKITDYFYSKDFFDTLSNLIKRSCLSEKLGYFVTHHTDNHTGSELGIGAVMVCLCSLSRAQHYQCTVIQILQKYKEKVVNILVKGHSTFDKIRTVELLQGLSNHDCHKCPGKNFVISLIIECGVHIKLPTAYGPEIQEEKAVAASPCMPKLFTTMCATDLAAAFSGLGSKGCAYFDACEKFLQQIKVPDSLLERSHNRCFCKGCIPQRRDTPVYERGQPPMQYPVPLGWAKFALRPPPRADILDVFNLWHVAYHGIRTESIVNILEHGELLIQGDLTMSGSLLQPPSGHYCKDWKPMDWTTADLKQVFLSPSIKYASVDAYARRQAFSADKEANANVFGKVVLQVRIKPESYKVRPETLGLEGQRFDPYFKNEELEWCTPVKHVVILTGILVKLIKEG